MAAEYDANVRATIPNYDRLHSETVTLVSAIKPNPRTWLDTGCGTGTMVTKAMEFFKETEFMVADPSKAMLDIAEGKLSASCGDRIRIAAPISTEDLAFPDGAFDVITAIQCHHYLDLETRKRATANCFRMLKHQGAYVFLRISGPVPKPAQESDSIGGRVFRSKQVEVLKKPKSILQDLETNISQSRYPNTLRC